MFLIEILALIFLSRKNGQLALEKGLRPGPWKWYTVIAWISGELIGTLIGAVMLIGSAVVDVKQIDKTILLSISFIALFTAFGGYLLIRYILENKSGNDNNDDVNRIGIDDLRPPGK